MTKRALVFLLLVSVACSRTESAPDRDATPPAAQETAAQESAAQNTSAPIRFSEPALIDYERGIAKEIELVKAARQRAANASTPAERAAAAQAEWEEQTIPAAAKAAGIDEAVYRRTREAVHTVLETLDFQGKIDGPLEMDLSRADEATKARLARDPFDALAPGAAVALRSRMSQILPLWMEYTRLTALHG